MKKFFVTPTRLTKSPTFWKTVKMMKQLNPERASLITMPVTTERWLRSDWHTISPENVVFCLDYTYGDLRWEVSPEQAQKVMKILLEEGSDRGKQIALKCSFTSEAMITKFIEERLSPQLKTAAPRTTYGRLAGEGDILSILRNASLKQYQIELMWGAIPESNKHEYTRTFGENAPLEMLPDYMFKRLLNHHGFNKVTLSGYNRQVEFLEEAFRRGFLVETTPAKVTVGPQSRPAIAKPTEVVNEEGKEVSAANLV